MVNLFLCVILLVKYFLVVTIYKDLVAALDDKPYIDTCAAVDF